MWLIHLLVASQSAVACYPWDVWVRACLQRVICQFVPKPNSNEENPRKGGARGKALLGVPEKEQKQTKTSGRFHDLIILISTNVLMIQDSVRFFLLVETTKFWWKLFWWKQIFFGGNKYFLVETNLGGNYLGGKYFFGGNYFLVEKFEVRIAKKEELAI
jgi:hypothetical protein